jgi:hypothetical protein
MDKFGVVGSIIGRNDIALNRMPSKKSIITLGGCNFMEIFSPFGDLFDSTHFWRAAIPSIASQPITLQHIRFKSEKVTKFLDRETSKIVYKRIMSSPDSIIAFEVAGEFANNFLRIEDTIIPDIRGGVFGDDFRDLTFDENPELAKAAVISPDTEYYWDLWKYHFDTLFKNTLSERIQRGIDVIFLSRRFCLHELKDGEFAPLWNSREIARRNLILDDLEDFISKYEGIKIVKSTSSLLFTSVDSPWGGPWEFHPEHAYYADMRAKFLEIFFPGKGKGAAYLTDWLAQTASALSKTKSLLALAELTLSEKREELERANSSLDEARFKIDEGINARLHLESEIGGAIKEREMLCSQLKEMELIIQQSQVLCESLRMETAQKEDLVAEQTKTNERLTFEIKDLEIRISELQTAIAFSSYRYSSAKGSIFNRLRVFLALYLDKKRLRRFGFSEETYLKENPDVSQARMDGLEHYLLHGMTEGRKLSRAS